MFWDTCARLIVSSSGQENSRFAAAAGPRPGFFGGGPSGRSGRFAGSGAHAVRYYTRLRIRPCKIKTNLFRNHRHSFHRRRRIDCRFFARAVGLDLIFPSEVRFRPSRFSAYRVVVKPRPPPRALCPARRSDSITNRPTNCCVIFTFRSYRHFPRIPPRCLIVFFPTFR